MTEGDIFLSRGWQDKASPTTSEPASSEPDYSPSPPQVPETGSKQATGYVTAAEFAEIERMRGKGKKKLTRSKVVTKLIRLGLQLTLDNNQLSMLEPRIEQTINRRIDFYMKPIRLEQERLFKVLEKLRFIIEDNVSQEEIDSAKNRVEIEFKG
jgi:hypothetical protein